MKNVNINRDKLDLTDEQILKHKNFDAVMNTVATGATKLPWYKAGKFWLIGGSIIVMVSTVIVLSDFETKEKTESAKEQGIITESESDSENSIEVIEKSTESEQLSVLEYHLKYDRIVFTRLGTPIELPLAVYGEISGVEVDEFDVRMTELPVPDNLELEPHSKIESFQIEVFIANEKANFFGSDGMKFIEDDVHLLTYKNGNWIPIEPLEIRSMVESVIDSSTTMIKPIKKSKRSFAFDVSYGLENQIKEFPELLGYKNLIFEPLEPQKDAFYSAEWSKVIIEKLEIGKYRLHLKLFDVEKTCDVQVVFEEEDYNKAVRMYKKSFKKEEEEKTESVLYLQNGGKFLAVYL